MQGRRAAQRAAAGRVGAAAAGDSCRHTQAPFTSFLGKAPPGKTLGRAWRGALARAAWALPRTGPLPALLHPRAAPPATPRWTSMAAPSTTMASGEAASHGEVARSERQIIGNGGRGNKKTARGRGGGGGSNAMQVLSAVDPAGVRDLCPATCVSYVSRCTHVLPRKVGGPPPKQHLRL